MQINRIGNGDNRSFRGYNHEINDYGRPVIRFNYPFDCSKKAGKLEIRRVVPDKYSYSGYKVVSEGAPIYSADLKKEGVVVDPRNLHGVEDTGHYAYHILVDGKPVKETGVSMTLDNDYVLVSMIGTAPKRQGAGYLLMADNLPRMKRAGYGAENPDEILPLDIDYQREVESSRRTYSNVFGGTLTAAEVFADDLRKIGIKNIPTTPIANGDDLSGHMYWNKNNFLTSPRLGSLDDYDAMKRKMYLSDQRHMFDGTFTSEGVEGIHMGYALRWLKFRPDELYRFNMESLKDGPLTVGMVPKNKENFRVRFVNPPEEFVVDLNGKVELKPNKKYDSSKNTYIQAYDRRYVSQELLERDELITSYDKLSIEDKLGVNTFQDTNVPYHFEVLDWNEIRSNVKKLNALGLSKDSADGAITLFEMSHIRAGNNTEGANTWDSNNDMILERHEMSAYDEDVLNRETEDVEHDKEFERKLRGSYQTKDGIIRAGVYWTEHEKDLQILTGAQILKGASSVEDIKKLVDSGELNPIALEMTEKQIKNALNGRSWTGLPEITGKDDTTARALMKTPLETLEFSEELQGIMGSSYFSAGAVNEEQLGKTRYELDLDENPHLDAEHAMVYMAVNNLFRYQMSNFAHRIFEEFDRGSEVKIFDKTGEYTNFGRYVVNIMGPKIARYALLKAMAGDNCKTQVLDDGRIIYNYDLLRDNTTLKKLGINERTPGDEANAVLNIMTRGLNDLDKDDVSLWAKAMQKQLRGLDENSFRIASLLYLIADRGLSWRLDAIKDIMNMDSVRNHKKTPDLEYSKLVKFLTKFVEGVKQHNPGSPVTQEHTDEATLLGLNYGREFVGKFDALSRAGAKFKNHDDLNVQTLGESGITTAAGYNFFFTNPINVFSRDFETGGNQRGSNPADLITEPFKTLLNTRSIDYIRNQFNFVGNQDKPRVAHNMALDLGLFYGRLVPLNNEGKYDSWANKGNRELGMLLVSGCDKLEDMPLELRFNIDNIDYVRTISPRALAMSKLLKESMEDLRIPKQEEEDWQTVLKTGADELKELYSGREVIVISDDVRDYMLKGLADLTEGRYLNYGPASRETIKLPELKTMYSAVSKMLDFAEIPEEIKADLRSRITEKANSNEYLYRHLVNGAISDEPNMENLRKILGRNDITPEEAEKYNLFILCLSLVIKDALDDLHIDSTSYNAVINAIRSFVIKYNSKMIKEKSSPLPMTESAETAMRKNGYAANDIQFNIQMLMEQAEYLARKDGVLGEGKHFSRYEDIVQCMYLNAMEPAAQKVIRLMHLLFALPGSATLYHGDELLMTGGEEKTKNVYLDRNALKLLELYEGKFKLIRQKMANRIEHAVMIRSREGIDPLNDGTPYFIDSNNGNVVSYLSQNSDGEAVVTLINLSGVSAESRVDYSGSNRSLKTSINPDNKYVPAEDEIRLGSINLPEGISLPEGTKLVNTDVDDDSEYQVCIENGKYVIKRVADINGGTDIVMDSEKAKFGVFILTTMTTAVAAAKQAGRRYKKGIVPGTMRQYLSKYLSKPVK